MHWMLEGQWYSVDYDVFAAQLGFSEDDLQRDRIHTEQVLPALITKMMGEMMMMMSDARD